MSQFLCIKRVSALDATWDAALKAKLEITVDLELLEADNAELTANQSIVIFTCVDSHDEFVKKELTDRYHISQYIKL